jgi:AcrR family transcriptional regulator
VQVIPAPPCDNFFSSPKSLPSFALTWVFRRTGVLRSLSVSYGTTAHNRRNAEVVSELSDGLRSVSQVLSAHTMATSRRSSARRTPPPRRATRALPEPVSMLRIRRSTLRCLRSGGVLGLRVIDVAKGAKVSVALLYKHFGDRDGLLADVLGAVVQHSLLRHTEALLALMAQDEMTPTMLMPPAATGVGTAVWLDGALSDAEAHLLCTAAHAAAADNPTLARHLRAIQADCELYLASYISRLAEGSPRGTTDVSPHTTARVLLALADMFAQPLYRREPPSEYEQRAAIRLVASALSAG